MTASTEPVASGIASAVPSIASTSVRAARIAGIGSTAITLAPLGRSARVRFPVPAARSSTSAPGPIRSRSQSHAIGRRVAGPPPLVLRTTPANARAASWISAVSPPSASSFERVMAAWIAFRNAARTPACSSSWMAAIVVPPGDVTISRSSTGCMPPSRRSFAVPSIVCTTSCVEISRESPSRIPASIMDSASSAKYAGPEPETAVTASM